MNGPDARLAPPRGALDPLGRALLAYQREGRARARLHVAGVGASDLDLGYFFRSGRRLTAIDRAALEACRGTVLDVGAGVGALALPLQARGHAVTALETLPAAVRILRERGVADVRPSSLWTLDGSERWDTVVVLMNGTTLAGTRARLAPMLSTLARCVAPGGRLLIDSTDVGPDPADPAHEHPGEFEYQIEFEGRRGPPFSQLFVDEAALRSELTRAGLAVSGLRRMADGRYLLRGIDAEPVNTESGVGE